MAATGETESSEDWARRQAGRAIAPGADWRAEGDFSDIRYETSEGIAATTSRRSPSTARRSATPSDPRR
jgi:hypothetical protein